ncbi:MAG: ribosome silencing factor [Syntrophales bacterium]
MFKEVCAAAPSTPLTPAALLELAVRTIVAHKGIEPVVLEVEKFCSFADFFILCSGGSRRHVLALAQHLEEALSQAGVKPLGVEGLEEGQWVLLDYNSLIIHIFLEPLRDFYNLEDLWSEAPRTPIDTDNYSPNTSLSPQEPATYDATDPESIRHE